MDLAPSDEQVMLRDMVRRFLDDRLDATTMGKGPMAAQDWRALGELGLFAFLLPERAGGMGGGAQDVMIVAEELGRSLAITPLAESVLLCAGLFAQHGTQAQIDRWVEPLLSGDAVLGFAQGGSIDGDVVSGNVGLVRDGMAADAFVVATRGGAIAVVPADAAGVSRSPVRMVDGSIAAQVTFESVACETIDVPAEGQAEAKSLAELAVVAELVGAMSRLLDLTVDYVKQRKQFGKAVASFQVIQHRCARMYLALEQSRSLLIKAALTEGSAATVARTSARAFVADAALQLAEDCVQLHGGMGVTEELAVGRGLRRVLLLSKLFGGSASARAELAA
jgi:alkylation response protein AidB-like acyl-CoA dehydrogenase